MAYGAGFIDTIIPTTDLTITGNVQASNITCTNITSGQGKIYPLIATTAVPTTSGTVVTIATGIPDWVTKISIVYAAMSTNSTSQPLFQLGYGSTPTYQTSGYASTGDNYSATGGAGPAQTDTTGMIVGSVSSAAYSWFGIYVIAKVTGTNTWIGGINGSSSLLTVTDGGVRVTLNDTLTAIRLTTIAGTNVFDAGNVCILYE